MSLSKLIDETLLEMVNVRNEPVQVRSSTRISALVDAAAEVVDEVGVERMTTAMVAERAGASIGTVYRYFPDRIAVLSALSLRSMDRFLRQTRENILRDKPETWIDLMMVAFDTNVEMHRTEVGFTSIRLGDLVSYPDTESQGIRSERIASAFAEIITQDFGVKGSAELTLRLEMSVNMSDSLVTRAFIGEKTGDARIIAEARSIVHGYLSSAPSK
ncbi:TetR/AcrR family transcriptional regulator [Subtercola frigoramans]|uniref:AcrR family transcriptional regulator n=1 Tax=Subtercola frigoramans TaxID=120298 RepID=A0ABS2L6B7_9MICO|nr:TetR/AcrR family transcriptional regulator [Subtercola frigoramans]MBM7472647.1 AcrR family transcriptional regulator [Subtercola frigoramans]